MDTENIEILSDAIREYFGNYELEELCGRFNYRNRPSGRQSQSQKLVAGLMAEYIPRKPPQISRGYPFETLAPL